MLLEINKGNNVISSKLSPPFNWIIAFKKILSSFFRKSFQKSFDKIRQKSKIYQ